MCLGINIGSFHNFCLFFTFERKWKKNTNRFNYNRQKNNLSPYIHKTGHRFPYQSNCAQLNLNFIIQKNYRTTEDLINKVVTSTLDISLRVPPLKSETGCTGELWLNTSSFFLAFFLVFVFLRIFWDFLKKFLLRIWLDWRSLVKLHCPKQRAKRIFLLNKNWPKISKNNIISSLFARKAKKPRPKAEALRRS